MNSPGLATYFFFYYQNLDLLVHRLLQNSLPGKYFESRRCHCVEAIYYNAKIRHNTQSQSTSIAELRQPGEEMPMSANSDCCEPGIV